MSKKTVLDKMINLFGAREVVKTEILNVEMNLEIKDKYKKFLVKESNRTGLSVEEILESAIDLYANKNQVDVIEKLSEQEQMLSNFKKDLDAFLSEHLKRESPRYDVVASWCDCISDKNITDRNLDYQIRKIIEMLYNKHQMTARKYFNKMGISRYELRDIIVKIIGI